MIAQPSRFVELWNVCKTYPGPSGPVTVVRNFSLLMRQGEFVSIIGHSGCGKSTVLMMIAGLTTMTSGNIIVGDEEVERPGPDRGVVFQSPSLLPWQTAEENVLLGVSKVKPRASLRERTEIAQHYLRLVGLGEAMHKLPAEMSGGMRQRVGIARAFALSPNMLLLDEPFGMLDQLTRMELQDVLIDLCAVHNRTAVMVTHDVDEALLLSDRIVMMTSGPAATVGRIMTVPFERPRNRAMLLEDPEYYRLREELIEFLEEQDTHRAPPSALREEATVTPSPSATGHAKVESLT